MRAADPFVIQGAYASTTGALASRLLSALQMGLVGAVFLVSRTVTTA
jgi:cell division protein FtsX